MITRWSHTPRQSRRLCAPLEDSEIKAIFEHVSGTNAKRNETLLIAVESHGVAEGYACVLHRDGVESIRGGRAKRGGCIRWTANQELCDNQSGDRKIWQIA